MKNYREFICLILCLCFFGCAHYPINAKPGTYDKNQGYRFKNLSSPGNSDSLFVILAFSGGGTRAAALSYGVLETLRDTEITWERGTRRLLDEVDVIAAVSGGSFTAAYFALYGDGAFEDFETQFLKQNIQDALAYQLFSPINWIRLLSPHFDRTDMAAEYYDEHIFDHRTFNDLLESGRRPYIVINAMDMSLGARFEFTQDQFDLICSNLSELSIGRAVAASSAFPILLSPITLRNHTGTCNFEEPDWVDIAMNDRNIVKRRFNRALQMRSYQNSQERPFIHLLDGGVADNIGLRGPYYALSELDSPWSVLRMINLDRVKKVLVIVVNAKTDPDTKMDQKENAPGWKDVLMTVATDPLDNFSFDTIELLVNSFKQWKMDYESIKSCEKKLKELCPQQQLPRDSLTEVDFYAVVVGFDMLEKEEERAFFKNLPTTFKLPPETIDRLRGVASKLLHESPAFKDFLSELQ